MSEQPGPSQNPYGQPVPSGQGDPYGQPTGQPYGYGQSPYGGPPARGGDRRPGTVTAGAWIAIVFSGLMALLFAGVTLVAIAAREDLIAELERQPEYQDLDFDLDQAYGVGVAMFAGIAVWCVIALVLAIFVLRRSNVARILLVISAAVAAVLSLLGVASGVSLIPLVACLATIVLLFTGGANEWFRRMPGGGPGDPAGYQATPYGGYGAAPSDPYQRSQQDAPSHPDPSANPYGDPYGSSSPPPPSSSPNPYGQYPPTHQDPDQPDDQGGQEHPPRDYPGR